MGTPILRMRTSTLLGLERVRIIEVPDKRGLDNRGCTVACILNGFKEIIMIIMFNEKFNVYDHSIVIA